MYLRLILKKESGNGMYYFIGVAIFLSAQTILGLHCIKGDHEEAARSKIADVLQLMHKEFSSITIGNILKDGEKYSYTIGTEYEYFFAEKIARSTYTVRRVYYYHHARKEAELAEIKHPKEIFLALKYLHELNKKNIPH